MLEQERKARPAAGALPSAEGPAPYARATAPVSVGGARAGYGALLTVLPVGIYTVGADHLVRSMNPEAARLTGAVPEAVIGRRCEEVLACSFCDQPGGCVVDQARRDADMRLDSPVEIRRADGTRLKVRVDAVPLGGGEVAITLRDAHPPGESPVGAPPLSDDPHQHMREALTRAAGSVTLAARLLGVHRTTLWRWMCEAGLDRKSFMPV